MTKLRRTQWLTLVPGLISLGCSADESVLSTDQDGGPTTESTGGATNENDGSPGAGGEVGTGGSGNGPPAPLPVTAAPDSDWGRGAPAPGVTQSDKIDLLFVVDNSASMADKQEILRRTIPDLVGQLSSPVDFAPFTDIHIGVITSSIGSFGANTCEGEEELNDRGHLVGTRPRALGLGLTDGFLRWTPQSDPTVFASGVQQVVDTIGELGCGFEAPLEALYHFLIDPAPYEQIVVEPCSASVANPCAVPTGVDAELLAQREAFLRPDSVLAVVVLTDEDDCSMQPTGQLYYPARSDLALPRATSVCAENPNDECCHSCGTSPPAGCQPDPVCEGSGNTVSEDPLNLRCFDQKRRFGIDFLYPVERYLAGLTNREVDSNGSFVSNPIFSGPTGQVRDPSQVIVAGIVGVPWQDLASTTDLDGDPLPEQALRFKSAAEMTDVWPLILGNPAANVPPADPLMVQSIYPRSGDSPLVGALAPPSAGPGANAANGHEFVPARGEDLQYACIMPLPEPIDCSLVAIDDPRNCECKSDRDPAGTQNPLCQDPETGAYGTMQHFAKAYPTSRHLQVLKGVGPRGVTTSICARNTTDPSRVDFGYRPVVRSLLERLAAIR